MKIKNFDSYSFFFWQLVNHNDVMSPPPPKCKQKQYCHTFFNILWFKSHVGFVEWVFWQTIKVNIKQAKVLYAAFKAITEIAMHPTKNPMAGSIEMAVYYDLYGWVRATFYRETTDYKFSMEKLCRWRGRNASTREQQNSKFAKF